MGPRCVGCAEMGGGAHASPAAGAFGGAPHGAAILLRGMPTWAGENMRNPAAGAFGRAPYGAAVLVR
eukprot:5157726-Pyramimonas_sp.AAC.1